MGEVARFIETANELGECFAIFRVHRGDWEGSTTVWTAALDRVRDGGRAQRLAYLELALDLCDEFRDQGLIDRMLSALMEARQWSIKAFTVKTLSAPPEVTRPRCRGRALPVRGT